jgi:D-alanine-D-alanine ligase
MFAEWDTMETVHAVRDALAERYDVMMIEADEGAYEKLRKTKPFFAFNIAEGLHGPSREGQLPSMLEMLRIPYLGSDPLTLGICLVKSRAKEVLSYYGVPIAPHAVVSSMEECASLHVRYPSIVKPLHEGSSKGIYDSCVVRSAGELEREVGTVLETYREPALVEEFLPGREFTVAMMGNGEDLRLLPVIEMRFDALPPGANPIYSYEAKWIWDTVDKPLDIYDCPASLDGRLKGEIESICRKAYGALGCRDWTRIDLRCNGAGQPCVIEVNPLPGILPRPEDNSCFPTAARAVGMTYNELINSVLDIALKRCGIPARELRAAIPAVHPA